MSGLLNSLNKSEKSLIRETKAKQMATLDEDGLVDLHKRIRRARDKYVGIYRRQASSRVPAKGARGTARPKNSRNAGRAEVFEDALARVSERLSKVAAKSARDLKKQRLAAAAKGSQGGNPNSGSGVKRSQSVMAGPQVRDQRPKGAGKTKKNASSQAQGVRRQAKRDSR